MKLGAALTLRAYNAQKLAELRGRLLKNAAVQEGDQPSEQPESLINQYDLLSQDYTKLVEKINKTNLQTAYGDGTLAAALLLREHKRRLKNTLEQAIEASQPKLSRYMRSELRMISHIDVATLQQRVDELTEEIRQIDADIQTVNWATDLVE